MRVVRHLQSTSRACGIRMGKVNHKITKDEIHNHLKAIDNTEKNISKTTNAAGSQKYIYSCKYLGKIKNPLDFILNPKVKENEKVQANGGKGNIKYHKCQNGRIFDTNVE